MIFGTLTGNTHSHKNNNNINTHLNHWRQYKTMIRTISTYQLSWNVPKSLLHTPTPFCISYQHNVSINLLIFIVLYHLIVYVIIQWFTLHNKICQNIHPVPSKLRIRVRFKIRASFRVRVMVVFRVRSLLSIQWWGTDRYLSYNVPCIYLYIIIQVRQASDTTAVSFMPRTISLGT